MSNYNVPDKIDGEFWNASDHNAIKVAVNSKQDKSNMVQDLNTPSNNTYPSTSAIATAFQQSNNASFQFRGLLTGTENLHDKILSGYFILPLGVPPNDPSYPYALPTYVYGGDFVVFADGQIVNQEIRYNGDGTANVGMRIFRRWSNDGGVTYKPWYELPTTSWVVNNYAPFVPLGVPTITAADEITIVAPDVTDLKGLIIFTNNSDDLLDPGTNIKIEFQIARSGLRSVQLTEFMGSPTVRKVTPYSQPTNTETYIRINVPLEPGESGSFFYDIS